MGNQQPSSQPRATLDDEPCNIVELFRKLAALQDIIKDSRDTRMARKMILRERGKLCKHLRDTADYLSQTRKDVFIANTTGTVAGIVGGSLCIAGFALAAPTFGLSLGLTIGGGVLGALGGITSIGSKLVERKKGKDTQQNIKTTFDKHQEEIKAIFAMLDRGLLKWFECYRKQLEDLFKLSEDNFVRLFQETKDIVNAIVLHNGLTHDKLQEIMARDEENNDDVVKFLKNYVIPFFERLNYDIHDFSMEDLLKTIEELIRRAKGLHQVLSTLLSPLMSDSSVAQAATAVGADVARGVGSGAAAAADGAVEGAATGAMTAAQTLQVVRFIGLGISAFFVIVDVAYLSFIILNNQDPDAVNKLRALAQCMEEEDVKARALLDD